MNISKEEIKIRFKIFDKINFNSIIKNKWGDIN